MKPLIFGLMMTGTAVISAWAAGASWQPVGFGTMSDSTRFRVFVDTGSIQNFGEKVRFWQGHVFFDEQHLPSGAPFIRISISRVVDCVQRSDTNLEAIFYNPSGEIVYKYSASGGMKFDSVKADTISAAVLHYVCDYVDKDR